MFKKEKTTRYQTTDRIIRLFLLMIWIILLIFGMVTLIQPKWLKELSKPGRKEEAESYINKGNRILYSANNNNSKESYHEAIICYREALKIDSLSIEAKANLGVTYLYLNELEDAKAIFEECIKKDTSNCYHYNAYLGDYYERKGNKEKAISYYLLSAIANPDPSYPLRKAGLFSIQLNKFEDAIKLINQSISVEKSFEFFYLAPIKAARHDAIANNDTINLKIVSEELKKSDYSSDLNRYDMLSFDESYKTSKSLGYAYMYLGDAYSGLQDYKAASESYLLSLQYYPSFNKMIKEKLDFANGKLQKH